MSVPATRILVTGATGLIGRELCRQAGERYEIHGIARGGGAPDLPVRWIEHDLAEPPLPEELPAGVDTVVHLAQSPHFRDFPARARDIYEVNTGSTARLLDWAQSTGVARFIFASSGGIYGHGDQEFREDDQVGNHGPLGFYLASKHCSELLVENYTAEMIVVILRFFFVYGPEQRETMLMPRLVRSVSRGQPVQLQGQDGIRINPVHVRDAARAVSRALRLEESQKVNVAGAEPMSLREVANRIGRAVDREPVFEVDEKARPNHLVADIGKMRRILTAPEVTFDEGVRDMLRFA